MSKRNILKRDFKTYSEILKIFERMELSGDKTYDKYIKAGKVYDLFSKRFFMIGKKDINLTLLDFLSIFLNTQEIDNEYYYLESKNYWIEEVAKKYNIDDVLKGYSKDIKYYYVLLSENTRAFEYANNFEEELQKMNFRLYHNGRFFDKPLLYRRTITIQEDGTVERKDCPVYRFNETIKDDILYKYNRAYWEIDPTLTEEELIGMIKILKKRLLKTNTIREEIINKIVRLKNNSITYDEKLTDLIYCFDCLKSGLKATEIIDNLNDYYIDENTSKIHKYFYNLKEIIDNYVENVIPLF